MHKDIHIEENLGLLIYIYTCIFVNKEKKLGKYIYIHMYYCIYVETGRERVK
jgi:hypothetical protein